MAKRIHLETVNHSRGEYARGKVHVNTVETEFSVFRLRAQRLEAA
ncbi:MAG: hypothetical protein ACP5JW_06145 [Candidatus Bathyarchaeia archaeon]